MSPLFALSLAAMSAAPSHQGGPVAVIVVRRTSVDVKSANALADWVADLLGRAGVAVEPPVETGRRLSALGVKDTTRCGGRKACVLELLRQLERPAGVALSISQVGSDRSVVLEALRASDGAMLAKDAAVLKAGDALDAAAIDSVAHALVKEWPAQPKVDVPVAQTEPPKPVEPQKPAEPALVPKPAEPPVVVAPGLEPIPEPRSHAKQVVLVAASVVAAGVAAGFAAGAFSAKGQLAASQDGRSPYMGSEGQKLANAANLRGTVAASVGGLAVVLAVGAVVTW
jgi:hypothetical protein